MPYQAPKINDLGQLTEHVFLTGSLDLNEEPGVTGGGGLADGVTSTTGSSGGLAGLGLIGGLIAAVSGRSNQQVINTGTSRDQPERDRPNER